MSSHALLAAELLIRHGEPKIASEEVRQLFLNVDATARAEEAVAIGELLSLAGYHAAAQLLVVRSQARLESLRDRIAKTRARARARARAKPL